MNIAKKRESTHRSKTSRPKKTISVVAGLAVLVAGLYVLRGNGLSPSSNPGQATAGDNVKSTQDAQASGGVTPGAGTATPGSGTPNASPTSIRRPSRTPTPQAVVRPGSVSGSGVIPNGWPTPSNTGWRHTGVNLSAYTGPVKITSPTVIDGKDINGCLVIKSSNVTIKRSRIKGPGCSWLIEIAGDTRNVLLEDVEIMSTSKGQYSDRAIVMRGNGTSHATRNVIRRAYIHDVSRGILYDSGGKYVLVENNYIEAYTSNLDDHIAAMTIYGVHEAIIRKNSLDVAPPEAASGIVVVYPDWGDATNVVFEENLLNGSGYWCTQIATHLAPGQYFIFRNNLFGVKYGNDPCTGGEGDGSNSFFFCDPRVQWTNNRWWAPGASRHLKLTPIDPQCA
jgi:hypothetical protein